MNKIQFSVLLSVYKKEDVNCFSQAMKSIWDDQTLKPDEIVLVKDGPLTHDLEEAIAIFQKEMGPNLKILALPENKGLGHALRAGLKECKYEWIARMDTDDICYPERFEKQINFLKKHPEIDVLGTNVEEFNETPGDLKSYRIMPKNGKRLKKYAKYRSPVNHPSILFRKESVVNNGGYNGDIRLFEDFALFIRMLKAGSIFYNMQEILLYFRIGTGIDTIKRRSGLHYVKSELKFINYAYDIGHLSNKERLFSIFTKTPLRFLPPKITLFIYNSFLRKT